MMKNIILVASIAGADQMIKCLIRQYPSGHTFINIPGLLRITHCTNKGAAFSILSGNALLLIGVSLLLMLGIVWLICREMHLRNAARVACLCLLGGGVGNLIDRICFGGVTDYIELLFFSFPVFNLADISITISISVLLAMTMLGKLEE